MRSGAGIDRSLPERRGIVRLLTRVEDDAVTVDDLEEIGSSLHQSEERALPLLVRRLWHTHNGSLFSRYVYLLHFFDQRLWLDQLIDLALHRRHLSAEAKAALRGMLQHCGVDTELPLLAHLVPPSPLVTILPDLMDQGDEGLTRFMAEFLATVPEKREGVLHEVASLADARSIPFFRLVVRLGDDAVTMTVVSLLGRIRSHTSADLLHEIREEASGLLREAAGKSLRRLFFVGVSPSGAVRKPLLPIRTACAGPIDAAGYRLVWVARPDDDGTFTALLFRMHDRNGMQSIGGERGLSTEDVEARAADLEYEEGAMRVPTAYALLLLRDAVHRSREQGLPLPPEFYVWSRSLDPDEQRPLPYEPPVPASRLTKGEMARVVAESAALFDDDCFAGWLFLAPRVCDFAEELARLEREAVPRERVRKTQGVVERFCRELLEPELAELRRRLLVLADFMLATGQDRQLVEMTAAVAVSLQSGSPPPPRHPFLRRLAVESMAVAREVLAEGYDLRQEETDGEEWDE